MNGEQPAPVKAEVRRSFVAWLDIFGLKPIEHLGRVLKRAPVSAAVDVVTIGGALVDRNKPYTVSKVERLGKDASKVIERLAE